MQYIDLTTTVSHNSPLMQWAKEQKNPHIAMGHLGTHLDTYEKTVIPLSYIKSNGIVFDVRELDEVDTIPIDCIEKQDFVCFRTGQIEKYPYGSPEYFKNHPQLSHALIEQLLEKQIRFIGIDAPGIRRHEQHEQADRLCEKHGIYVIENLKALELLPQRFSIYTMWIDDEQMTGLKCRVVAQV